MSDFEVNFELSKEVEHKNNPISRKRKIDKDGFVCPSTPDVHRNIQSDAVDNTDENNHGKYDETEGEEVKESGYFSEGSRVELECQPDEGGAAPKERHSRPETVLRVITDSQSELKILLKEWGEIFRRSEDFEHQCPVKLDQLITEATDLEQSLADQKNILCQRLYGIGETLKM